MSVDISVIDVQRNVKTLKELLDFVILKIYSSSFTSFLRKLDNYASFSLNRLSRPIYTLYSNLYVVNIIDV